MDKNQIVLDMGDALIAKIEEYTDSNKCGYEDRGNIKRRFEEYQELIETLSPDGIITMWGSSKAKETYSEVCKKMSCYLRTCKDLTYTPRCINSDTEVCESAGGGYKKTSQTAKVGKATRCVYTAGGHKYVKSAGKFVPLKQAQKAAAKKEEKTSKK